MARDEFRWDAGIFAGALALRVLLLAATFDSSQVFEKYLLLARHLLESGGVAREPFAFSPAYTYLVAAVLGAGGGAAALAAAHAILGALACVAVAALGRRLFGPVEGRIAGAWAALFGPFLVASAEFEADGLGMLLFLAAALLAARAFERPSPRRFAAAGLLAGLRAIHRPDALLLLVALPAAWLLARRALSGRGGATDEEGREGAPAPPGARASRAAPAAAALAFVGAALLPVAPITWQNLRASGEFIPVTWSGGWVFYSSHNWQARGLSYFPPPLAYQMMGPEGMGGGDPLARLDDRVSRRLASLAAGKALSPVATSRFWLDQGLRSIARRGPAAAALLEARRLVYMVHGYEAQDNLSVLAIQDRLGVFSSGMGLLAPLAILGLALSLRRAGFWTRRAFAVPFLLLPVTSMLLFYVNGRLRLELEATLLPFGAAVVAGVARGARAGRVRETAWAIAFVAALGVLLNLPDAEIGRQARLRTVQLQTFLGERAVTRGDSAGAERRWTAATRAAAYPAEAESAWRQLAILARARGDEVESRRCLDAATGVLDPADLGRLSGRAADPDALWAVGRHHLIRGERDEAMRALDAAARLAPDDPEVLYTRAVAAWRARAADSETTAARAEEAFRAGLGFTPSAAQGSMLLATCLVDLGRRDDAIPAVETALRYAPRDAQAKALLDRLKGSAAP